MRALLLLLSLLACASLAAASQAEGQSWPATLLESGASALGKWTPTPRNRLEKLQLAQNWRKQARAALGSGAQSQLFPANAAPEAAGSPNDGKAKEPVSNVFDSQQNKPAEVPAPAAAPTPSPAVPSTFPHKDARAARKPCGTADNPCPSNFGPMPPPPAEVPVPPARPLPPAAAAKPLPTQQEYPTPSPDELPLPTPPSPSCGEACDPDGKNPFLARVPAPPLNDEAIAAVGLEGDVLAAVSKKIANRETWLRQQKLWLSKAVEAAATVKREIELAELTKAAVASDLEQLQKAQDALSIKYKADKLKWAFKDKKETLSQLHERLEALAQAKADVAHQIQEDKLEVDVLTSTLGPASEQVQISPEELEQPLKFLEDLHLEENYGK